jgi:transcriptional regulator of acetoin/glycerol metabolism
MKIPTFNTNRPETREMLHPDEHFRLIEKAVLAQANRSSATWRTASWARCLQDFKLNPSSADLVCLTSRELREERDCYTESLTAAEAELEAVLGIIEGGGYSAHIANRNGVIIADRQSKDSTYYCSLDKVGAVWNEEIGGTNGIGTSLRDLRATAVYLSDHFYADLTGEACAAAPFFDPYGEPLGVINLSTRNPGVPQLAHRVVFGIAQATAHRLETGYFQSQFRNCSILTVSADQSMPVIFAVDSDNRIAGATRGARKLFRLDDSAIDARSIWAVFDRMRGNPYRDHLSPTLKELRALENGSTFAVSVHHPASSPTSKAHRTPVGPKKPISTRMGNRQVSLAECAGNDPQMKRNVAILNKVAGSGLHLLLLGETGVGKDTLARAVHNESERASGPFIAFNCAAVPDSLIDSELFGYSPGAFTGANRTGNSGLILAADKGTLFLDEIGDMPLPLQTRLLRFLETHEVMPLGGTNSRAVDVQVIAATHQDLQSKVDAGQFRRDLFYRLAGAVILLPPLRERTDLRDIICNVLNSVSPDSSVTLARQAMEQMLDYQWPGNIRELRNVLTRATRIASGATIQPEDLMLAIPPHPEAAQRTYSEADRGVAHIPSRSLPDSSELTSKNASDAAIRKSIIAAMERHGADAAACSRALGISRATFYRKLKMFGLSTRVN